MRRRSMCLRRSCSRLGVLFGAWWLVCMRSWLTLHRSRFRRGRTFHLLLARRISRAFHLLFARRVSRTRGFYWLIRTRCRS